MTELKHEYTANTKTPEAEAKLVTGIAMLVGIAETESVEMVNGAVSMLGGMFYRNVIKADGEFIGDGSVAFRRILELELGED